MASLFTRARIGVVAAVVIAFSVPLLTPKPAEAWWRGPGWGYGWHGGGYGWHRWGWRGYGPRVVIGVPGPVVVGPPVYAYGPRPWIRAHWNGPYWVPGHWG